MPRGRARVSLPRTFEGVWFPRELWLLPQSQLKWSAKIILREVISLDGEAGCFAGNDHFVEFSGLNERTVQNVFGVLEARGYVRREEPTPEQRKRGIQRVLRAAHHFGIGGVKKVHPDQGERVKDSHPQGEGFSLSSISEQNNEQGGPFIVSDGGEKMRQPPPLSRHQGEDIPAFNARRKRYTDMAFRFGDGNSDGKCAAGHDVFQQLHADFADRAYDPHAVIVADCYRCAENPPQLSELFDEKLKARHKEAS